MRPRQLSEGIFLHRRVLDLLLSNQLRFTQDLHCELFARLSMRGLHDLVRSEDSLISSGYGTRTVDHDPDPSSLWNSKSRGWAILGGFEGAPGEGDPFEAGVEVPGDGAGRSECVRGSSRSSARAHAGGLLPVVERDDEARPLGKDMARVAGEGLVDAARQYSRPMSPGWAVSSITSSE